jgi:cytochrome b6-f complex iron-sulfur subunit
VSAEPPAAESAPAAAAPKEAAAKPQLKPGERPSVADIMAMARGGGGGQAEKPAAAKPKPAAAKGQAKPAAKAKAGPAKPAERMDTASILASARKEAKRGPVSKAEAASLPGAKKAAAAKPKPPAPKMPERPVYVSPLPAAKAEPDQRRRSLVFGAIFGTFLATGMTLLTATVGLWTLAFARFMFPNILTEPPSKFKIGFPDSIAPGTVETKFKAQFGVWVVNYEFQGQPMIYALSTVCTHLGCTPNWLDAEQKFKCPCHGSGFYKDGVNFEGPAPRPLERYAIRVADDGQLEIDKSQKFQEEMGQWEDTASYVPV